MLGFLRSSRKTLAFLFLCGAGTTVTAGEAHADPAARERAELLRTIRELTQRVRELEAQVRRLQASESRGAAPTQVADASCSTPFFMGVDGVRRVRVECLNQAATDDACASPFVLDASGIKRVKRACLTSMAAAPKSR